MSVPANERWLLAWGVGYGAAGAASLVVPLYAVALGGGAVVVSVLAATAALAGVPGAVLWGRLSSRSGRRRVFLLGSLGLTAASLAALGLVESLPLVVLANAVLWFAVAAAAPVLTLLVVDGLPEREWDPAIGRLNAYQGYGWLGGLLAGAAWTGALAGRVDPAAAQRAFLLVAAGATLLALVGAARWLSEPTVTPARFDRSTPALARLLGGPGGRTLFAPFGTARVYWALRRLHPRRLARRLSTALGTYLLAALCFFTGFGVFFGPLPAYLVGLGLPSGRVFGLFVASSAVSAALYGRVGSATAAVGARRLQAGALGGRVVIFPVVGAVGLAAGFPALLGLFGALGLTWALVAVTGPALVSRLAPASVRGDALGAYTALGSVGGGVGSLVGGVAAAAVGFRGAFLVAGACVAGGLALLVAARA